MAKTAANPAAGRKAKAAALLKNKSTGGKAPAKGGKAAKKTSADEKATVKIELGYLKYSKYDKVGDDCSCVRCPGSCS
jgi:hypothetical protein